MRSGHCDILVVGSGIAGLSFALHCSRYFPDKKIVVLSKESLAESNTRYAQGGIAAVTDLLADSFSEHCADTLTAGDGLCDPGVVGMVVHQAPLAIAQLEAWGIHFDRQGNELERAREGGHSQARVLHCKDHTGASISDQLLRQCRQSANIELREKQFVSGLLIDETPTRRCCHGVKVINGKSSSRIYAQKVMLACGGIGQLYQLSSNPALATGDGIGLARAAGVALEKMAYIQFHPTVLYGTHSQQPFLISEAVRGFGAILRNHRGEDFMPRYDARASLATRDIVSRAIFSEMQKSGTDHLWLDLRHLDQEEFNKKFPTIAARLEEEHIDPGSELLPIAPAAHYLCGGIATNPFGETSLDNLLACGETACTGLHGANRLASNSLLEAVVYAQQAALGLKSAHWDNTPPSSLIDSEPVRSTQPNPSRRDLQKLMTEKVGIVREKEALVNARLKVEQWLNEFRPSPLQASDWELQNMLWTALAIIEDSLQQTENRGTFYRRDLARSPSLV